MLFTLQGSCYETYKDYIHTVQSYVLVSWHTHFKTMCKILIENIHKRNLNKELLYSVKIQYVPRLKIKGLSPRKACKLVVNLEWVKQGPWTCTKPIRYLKIKISTADVFNGSQILCGSSRTSLWFQGFILYSTAPCTCTTLLTIVNPGAEDVYATPELLTTTSSMSST